ncbi:MAG: hypothetical protein JNL39_05395, partial [Opitutaceae bacterium]|nr:hypothetical protein [Opitutaceae bacterium]
MPRLSLCSIALVALAVSIASPRAHAAEGYRTPSTALAAIVDAPLPPAAVLSPDRRWLLLLDRPEAPSITELAQPELRLAGLRVNPATNGPSRATAFTGLALQPLAGGAARRVTGLPAGARFTDATWSRDGRHVAFAVVTETGLELWLAPAETAAARRLTGPVLNAMLGDPFVWLDDSTLLIRRAPPDRGAAPVAATAPTGPIAQENLGKRAPARTYDGLLASPHDERLFEHHGVSELALVTIGGALTPLPVRGLLAFVAPSPDGRHLIVSTIHRPFSYLVPSSRFPTTVAVHDRSGRREHVVVERPLSEGAATETVAPGPRSVAWRADAPATLSWVQSLPRNAKLADDKTTARDAWFTLAAPFTAQPTEQQRFEYRVTGVQWCDDALALVTESWATTRTARTWAVSPATPKGERTLLSQRNTEDRYADPGRPVTGRDARGRVVVQRSADGKKIFLTGAGASPDGDRPFLDELDLETKSTRRLWRSAPPHYEEFVAFADATLTRAVVARESPAEPMNYFVRTLASGELRPLTAFLNPYPQLTGATQEVLRYKRADGVALSGTLHLPPGWTPARGPLPTLLWAYPREFQSEEAASQVKATPERFARVSASGPLP